MIRYFLMKRKMKRDEVMVKATLYSTIASIVNEQKDILDLVQKLYAVLKDVPIDELRKEFIHSLAEIIHEENGKEN